jgi:hypothetical protein
VQSGAVSVVYETHAPKDFDNSTPKTLLVLLTIQAAALSWKYKHALKFQEDTDTMTSVDHSRETVAPTSTFGWCVARAASCSQSASFRHACVGASSNLIRHE